jgi:hypothetical protein
MNAARRVREAERVALFWQLVEHYGLGLEQLTTRVRRDLVAQAREIQQWVDRTHDLSCTKSSTKSAPGVAVVDTAPISVSGSAVEGDAEGGAMACAPALRGRPGIA